MHVLIVRWLCDSLMAGDLVKQWNENSSKCMKITLNVPLSSDFIRNCNDSEALELHNSDDFILKFLKRAAFFTPTFI